ncbi:Glycine-rich protein [Quillaja saponaria]|uniref:Glycine-rich protein n=1 Tax=Quillaja saponaria TaxID=32244 RepID=A0AAD7P647_QUISA|nr:Glycine-rich protein [Quillaja saponaria]
MAATAASDVFDGPVLNLINKRLRALRKKQNRILQMEEAISQGKPINKEQEEVLRSKPSVTALIDELEKLRQPLSSAVQEELNLTLSAQTQSLDDQHKKFDEPESKKEQLNYGVVEDLLNLLYFGSLFDVKSQSDFTSTMLTRTHERGCCLTYDYVTDDATDMLGERDLDLISMLGGLLLSRPADSSLSHKNALQRCVDHAKKWLTQSDQPIEHNANVTYGSLRERLNKIISSEYFTTAPEMKVPVEVVAANGAGNYAPFQVPVHASMVPVSVPRQVEGSVPQFQQKDERTANFQGHGTGDDQSDVEEDFQKVFLVA